MSPFCFVIGVEFAVIFGGGKFTINEIKRNCILDTLEIFYLHRCIPFFSFRAKNQENKVDPYRKKNSQLQVLVGSKSQDLSPISLKHNKVSFPNTATTGIKYALVLAAKIVFWTGTISACPLSNLKNLSLI